MGKYIDKNKWSPQAEITLEPAAKKTVISNRNTLVIAGPGAGKTELLAQRACFLLETNTCKYPRKILAISFKKDAAKNLKERIELRCGKKLSSRFESKTYDAFAKEILDRFKNGLEEFYRPSDNYKIAEKDDVKTAFIEAGLTDLKELKETINTLSSKQLPLSLESADEILLNTWKILLKRSKNNSTESLLTFGMISRLSEYLIRTNTYIKNALQITYSHVFLDEFQDTTYTQYDLIKSCFSESNTIITAVGDNKQRIMLWAGAKKEVFKDFKNDFNCDEKHLIINHRSAPRLVEIQKLLYNKLNEDINMLETTNKWNENDGKVYLRIFEDNKKEAEIISEEISHLINKDKIKANDICILVKQKVETYSEEIINKLSSEYNIKARNEAEYQDLLKEDIVKILLSLFRLASCDQSPDDWTYIYDVMSELYEINEQNRPQKLNTFINNLESLINNINIKLNTCTKENFLDLVDNIIHDISYEKISSKFHQYKSEIYFNNLMSKFKALLWKEYEETMDWLKAIDNFKGENSISIMTIHKSKGLEYDTVFFIGLEDTAFWAFNTQREEDICAFFVAFSRAKRRIDFTFCSNRPILNSWNNQIKTKQKHESIKEFYELLESNTIVEKIYYNEKIDKK